MSSQPGGPLTERRTEVGRFCISIDLELGWGIWDVPESSYMQRCLAHEHEIVARLLALFDSCEVSATWAFVGRLLERGGPHPPGWDDRLWYAPEVVDLVRGAATAQEIGSHSFEHVYFDSVSSVDAARDLARARELHARHSLEWGSFVFPRNCIAHLEELRGAGVRVFRGADEGATALASRLPQPVVRAARLLAMLVPLPAATVLPRVHGGLVEVPGSMLLPQRRGLRRLIRPARTVARALGALEHASETGRVFHLWFHPSNFYYDADVQFDILERILRRAVDLRSAGRLAIVPMRSFAAGATT